MGERLYQVKDIMQMCGISRDTIKYYEKQGLIEPSRNDNGYRVFDTFNVEKLKKILDLRDLGFTVQEIIEMALEEATERDAESLVKLRKRTEEAIRGLHQKLEKIRVYEQHFYENKRFLNGFNVECDFKYCLDCPMIEEADKCSYFVRNAEIWTFDNNGDLDEKLETSVILDDCGFKERCRECGKTREKKERVYRGMLPFEGEKEMQRVIWEKYQDAKQAGYRLKNKVCVTKKILKSEGKERLFLDIRIPVEK